MAIDKDNQLYQSNVFAPEFASKETIKNTSIPIRKKRKNKRLNTIDSEYLPDEEIKVETNKNNDNFFIAEKSSSFASFKKGMKHFFSTTPLINYFFLREKEGKIKKTVEQLNDITQNVDELLNSAVPYGEEKMLYQDIAQNLSNAATLFGKANKEI